jgi:hypothetical protein
MYNPRFITAYFDAELARRVSQICTARRLTKSEFVRNCVAQVVKAMEQQEPAWLPVVEWGQVIELRPRPKQQPS